MCNSQRSQAFELAATTQWLQVGGDYTVLIKTSYEALAKLITCLSEPGHDIQVSKLVK